MRSIKQRKILVTCSLGLLIAGSSGCSNSQNAPSTPAAAPAPPIAATPHTIKPMNPETNNRLPPVEVQAKTKIGSQPKQSGGESELDAIANRAYAGERARRKKADRRLSESKRQRIYFAYQNGAHMAMEIPNVGDGLKNALQENDDHIAAKYHLSPDELDSIRSEGDENGWPQSNN